MACARSTLPARAAPSIACVEIKFRMPHAIDANAVDRHQNLWKGKAGHKAVRSLLDVEATVERAQTSQDRTLREGRRLRRPGLAERRDLRRRRHSLKLDTLYRTEVRAYLHQ